MAKTILLADDSVTIQKVVELTFMDQDYQVVATGKGDLALEQLSEVGPDLVIADVHMPGADGYEVCRQTKARHPEIPVLLLVGTFEQFDEQQAAAAGADGHLKKPFDSQDLLSQVETLIARSSPAAAPAPTSEDVFGAPQSQELEPPPLEAPAEDDIWSTGPVDDAPPAVEAAPAFDVEPPAFDAQPPAFGASLDQEVKDTAAIGMDEARAALVEEPALELEEAPVADEVPAIIPMDESASDVQSAVEMAAESSAPTAELEVSPLEAPTLEAPIPSETAASIEDDLAEAAVPLAAVEPEASAEEVSTRVELEASPALEAIEPEPVELEAVEPEPVALEPEPVALEPEPTEPETVETSAAEPEAEEKPATEVAAAEPVSAESNGSGSLSDDDVERIARRVAELMGEKALRDVAWEVLPDLAEVIIKERIRELESQVV